MLADALGRPVSFALTAGQVHDVIAAPELIDGIAGDALIADKAYDSASLRQLITETGMLAVIPSTRSRKLPIPHDRIAYRLRNRIERCFNKLKHFRRF
jgi:transposase